MGKEAGLTGSPFLRPSLGCCYAYFPRISHARFYQVKIKHKLQLPPPVKIHPAFSHFHIKEKSLDLTDYVSPHLPPFDDDGKLSSIPSTSLLGDSLNGIMPRFLKFSSVGHTYLILGYWEDFHDITRRFPICGA
ncbi:hypothetical protein DH2020_022796 [Rehmannia glutinosa]|uniref:Uncharacterized protein n=1 Tax=Rehmannia glutinosa TaxID=99300 RepID=A0ABR0W466_REHGL